MQRGVSTALKDKSSIIADMEVLVSQGGFQEFEQALDEKQALEGQLLTDERISQLDLKSDQ